MDFIEALNWRYAAKNMTGEPVPQEKVDIILDAIRLSASSAGLQPYKVAVISNHELKGKIHEGACQQPQVVEGSHLLVFASHTSLTAAHIDSQMALVANTRGIPLESLMPFSDSIKGSLMARTDDDNAAWAARQAYIALGFALVAAAVEEVDATPMEGFNPDLMDELLGLKEMGLRSVVVMALGYRDAKKDFLANAKKVRRSREDLFIEIK